MPPPSVTPAILHRLKEYFDQKEIEYFSQQETDRIPTLPATVDGKINVRKLAEAIGLRKTQEKYLYERPQLFSFINRMAADQGLSPIGARLIDKSADEALLERLSRQAQQSKVLFKAAVEADSVQAELLQRISELEADNQRLSTVNLRLRAQLDLINAGTLIDLEE